MQVWLNNIYIYYIYHFTSGVSLVLKVKSSVVRSPSGESSTTVRGFNYRLTTTCSNAIEVAQWAPKNVVDHIQLLTVASETVGPIDRPLTPPLQGSTP